MTSLVTLKEYKDYVGISSTDQDTKIKNLILYVSDFVKQYCGRSFIDNYNGTTHTSIVEYWSGGVEFYYTNETPILTLVSVEMSEDFGTTYTTLTAGVDYALDMEKGRVYVPIAEEFSMVNAFKITYTGGFSTTPDSLKVAVLDLIEYYMKKESTPRKTSGSVSIEYIRSSDLPYHIKRVLDLYRVIE